MNRVPRLLPLVAVAIVGVLAVNALAGARSLPELISSARAFAEDAIGPAEKAAPKRPETKASPMPDVKTATAPPAAQLVCPASVEELAKDAGMSVAELQTLQNLGARREQLDEREKALETQLPALTAAEAKVDAKLAQLRALEGSLQTLLGQVDAQQQAEQARWVKTFETMPPRSAAPLMAALSDEVRLPVVARMKEAKLAAILAQMPPAKAKELTEASVRRYQEQQLAAARQAVASQAAAAAPAAPAAPAAAPAPRAPAQAAAPAQKGRAG